MVTAARQLFAANGYHQTSWVDIEQAVGAGVGNIRTMWRKEQLAIDALHLETADIEASLQTHLRSNDCRQSVLAWTTDLLTARNPLLLPVLLIEMAPSSSPVRDACDTSIGRLIATLERASLDPVMARTVLAFVLGDLLIARGTRHIHGQDAMTAISQLLDSLPRDP